MPGYWEQRAREIAAAHGLNPEIFARQIAQESGFNPNAQSPAGAAGIAQLMPVHWSAVNPWDPEAALNYAARLMRSHLDRYGGDYAKALAAYNAGPGSVDRWLQQYGSDWTRGLFDETRTYLRNILGGVEQAPAASGRVTDPAGELTRFREYVRGILGSGGTDGSTRRTSPADAVLEFARGIADQRRRIQARMRAFLGEGG